MLITLLLIAACGETIVQQKQDLAKKTVTITLHEGEELEIGGYRVEVITLSQDQAQLRINGHSLLVDDGKIGYVQSAQVTVAIRQSSEERVAEIKITER